MSAPISDTTPEVGTLTDAVYCILEGYVLAARIHARASWTAHLSAPNRDDLMREDEDMLVGHALEAPLTKVYPELPMQVASVIRDAFDDEHFKLEDPVGWIEIHADVPTPGENRR